MVRTSPTASPFSLVTTFKEINVDVDQSGFESRIGSVVDPHHFGNLDPHPDPHPHQIKIRFRIRIKVISWIRNWIRISNNLQMTSQNVLDISLFGHFFKGLRLYLEAGSRSASG